MEQGFSKDFALTFCFVNMIFRFLKPPLTGRRLSIPFYKLLNMFKFQIKLTDKRNSPL